MALRGKKVGFEKVIKMIDDLVTQLGKEQEDDDAHLKWCSAEFDTSEDGNIDIDDTKIGLSKFAKKHASLSAGFFGGVYCGYKLA